MVTLSQKTRLAIAERVKSTEHKTCTKCQLNCENSNLLLYQNDTIYNTITSLLISHD